MGQKKSKSRAYELQPEPIQYRVPERPSEQTPSLLHNVKTSASTVPSPSKEMEFIHHQNNVFNRYMYVPSAEVPERPPRTYSTKPTIDEGCIAPPSMGNLARNTDSPASKSSVDCISLRCETQSNRYPPELNSYQTTDDTSAEFSTDLFDSNVDKNDVKTDARSISPVETGLGSLEDSSDSLVSTPSDDDTITSEWDTQSRVSTSAYSSGSSESIDADETSNDCSIVVVNVHTDQHEFTATIDGIKRLLYSIDLSQTECHTLQTKSELKLHIERNRIRFVHGKVVIWRIDMPIRTMPTTPQHLNGTECILFSMDTPLMARYRENYYFVGARLNAEYIELKTIVDDPACKAIRIKTERIVIDKTSHVLDIAAKPTNRKENRQVFVIEANVEVNTHWRAFPFDHINGLHRFIAKKSDNECILHGLSPDLLYADCEGSFDEIYAESDYESIDYAEFQVSFRHTKIGMEYIYSFFFSKIHRNTSL